MRNLSGLQSLLGLGVGSGIAIACALAFTSYRDTVIRRWPTGTALRAAPESIQEWLPGWIPEEARDVHAVHSIALNRTWATLRLPHELLLQLLTAQPVSAAQVNDNPGPPFWSGLPWPPELRDLKIAPPRAGLRLLAGPDGRYCIATLPPSDTVYTWLCNWASR